VEDGIIKVEFVKSSENDSNILQRISPKRFIKKNVKKFLGD
jgi:hypothetical protein